jgi:hypothetical protein
VANGSVAGLDVRFLASGNDGETVHLYFHNTTDMGFLVSIPPGTLLNPVNSSRKSLVVAHGEAATANPVGYVRPDTGAVERGFDADTYHEYALTIVTQSGSTKTPPAAGEELRYGGIAEGGLRKTMNYMDEIFADYQQLHATDSGKHAVWYHTEGYDISNDPTAQEIVDGTWRQ